MKWVNTEVRISDSMQEIVLQGKLKNAGGFRPTTQGLMDAIDDTFTNEKETIVEFIDKTSN